MRAQPLFQIHRPHQVGEHDDDHARGRADCGGAQPDPGQINRLDIMVLKNRAEPEGTEVFYHGCGWR
jgi:hypothetical protein